MTGTVETTRARNAADARGEDGEQDPQERLKLVASLLHGVALATFGLGVLSLVFDPTAQPPGMATVVLGLMVAVASEAAAYHLLGRMKAES